MAQINAEKIKAIVDEAMELYNEATDEQKLSLKQQIEIKLAASEHGLKHIGIGFDPEMVEAGKEFLKRIG